MVVQCDGNRAFATIIALDQRWQAAGPLVLTAAIPNGKSATTMITVIPPGSRIVPSGLPMTVSSYTRNGSTVIQVKGEGWRQGQPVRIDLMSADGVVNAEVAAAVVGSEGRFGASFYLIPEWAARKDLGVRATSADYSQHSLRYLPVTTLTKVSGTSSTYEVRGFNWPGNSRMLAVLRIEGEEEEVIGSAASDANGAFALSITLPRIHPANKHDVEIRAIDQPYGAMFDF